MRAVGQVDAPGRRVNAAARVHNTHVVHDAIDAGLLERPCKRRGGAGRQAKEDEERMTLHKVNAGS